jgi:hypothetical protein
MEKNIQELLGKAEKLKLQCPVNKLNPTFQSTIEGLTTKLASVKDFVSGLKVNEWGLSQNFLDLI